MDSSQSSAPGQPVTKGPYSILSLVLLALTLVALLSVGVLSVQAVDGFKRMFAEMDVALPPITRLLLAPGSMLYGLIAAALIVALIGKEFHQNKRLTAIVNGTALLLVCTFSALLAVALFRPLVSLMNAVSAPASAPGEDRDAGSAVQCRGILTEYDPSYQWFDNWTDADGRVTHDDGVAPLAWFSLTAPQRFAGRKVGILFRISDAHATVTAADQGKAFSFVLPMEFLEDTKCATIESINVGKFARE